MAAKTVFIEHKVGGTLTDAYSVTLASSDSSYGIRELDGGSVVVSNGTAVTNPSTGRYEYTFDADPSKVYEVSWKVLTNSDSDAVYSVQNAGPFTSGANIQAITETRGVFKQGTIGALKINIADFEGNAVDPTSITMTVQDSDGDAVTDNNSVELDDVVPEKVISGFYAWDWRIKSDQAVGKYTVLWTYVHEGITEKEIQTVILATDSTDSVFYGGSRFILRESLEQLIACSMKIPIFFEQARPTRDFKMYRFTKGQWNQTPGIRLYRNDQIMDSSDNVEVDYFKGQIKFADSQLVQDVITADYTFRWFSDREIDQFIDNGINTLNAFPPFSPAFNANTLLTNGSQFIPAVLYRAAADAIRNIMMCLQFQQPQQFFGGADAAQKAFGNFESLKKNYESTWETLLDKKKLGPYPQSRLVVVPEFTLPGGRSRWFRYLFSSGS